MPTAEVTAWDAEPSLSVADAVREAMDTPQAHLPLRKASAQQLRSRKSAPQPLFVPTQNHPRVRGFTPSPVQALPRIADVTASNEHAFAARDENKRRPFNLPLDVQALGQDRHQRQQVQDVERPVSGQTTETHGGGGGPPPSPLLPPPASPRAKQKGLKSSKSFGEGMRGLRHRLSSNTHAGGARDGRDPSTPPLPKTADGEVRESFRSALTSNSSFLNTASINTDRSSQTAHSSQSEYVHVYPDWPNTEEEAKEDMTVEDAIGMYEDGFDSAKGSIDTYRKASFQDPRPSSQPAEQARLAKKPNWAHRRSQSASLLWKTQSYHGGGLGPSKTSKEQKRASTQPLPGPVGQAARPTSKTAAQEPVPRDRYGFKKVSHYVTVEQYDAWDAVYSEHVERRTKKWHALMRSYGLTTEKPLRFPPKSDKMKRYVRKGIPPDYRGAAWFWYAGGPGKLAKEAGLYWELVEQVKHGKLTDNDREHIERDLHRTFPDNVRFRPDPTTPNVEPGARGGGGGGGGGGGSEKGVKKPKNRHTSDPEMPVLRALRRVLQAFAVHNPSIGYCQSLNFIAGLLLLFLDEDEEKSFILLNIVTTTHLPGTHGVALEGANIDIAVLMSCIKDSLPAVWAKLDDKGGMGVGPAALAGAPGLRLPTVSLATTAWFMSLFVGTLPIESVLRVWDCLFFEGSKALFRIALAIFKCGERAIAAVSDPMEIFQLVQTVPRAMLDVNGLMDICFKRRGGFAHVSQELIEKRRAEMRQAVKDGVADVDGGGRWRRWKTRAKV